MNIIMQIVIMAILVEAIWETLKMVWQEGKLNINQVGALVVGLVVAFSINLDIFIAVGLEIVFPYVGVVASGILISRGGNYIHDLFSKLEQ